LKSEERVASQKTRSSVDTKRPNSDQGRSLRKAAGEGETEKLEERGCRKGRGPREDPSPTNWRALTCWENKL